MLRPTPAPANNKTFTSKLKQVILVLILLPVLAIGGCGAIVFGLLIFSSSSEQTTQNASSEKDHYQEAKTLIEQADKLISQPTKPADITLSETKLNQAKQHIAELPTTHTISEPQYSYRTSKSGRRRRRVSGYSTQQIPNEQFQEIQSLYEEVESRLAQEKQEQGESNALIIAAKQFAFAAAKSSQKPPHSTAKWEEVANLWKQSIERLDNVSEESPSYIEAQKLLVTYKNNLGTVRNRQQREQESVETLEQANRQIRDLTASVASLDRNDTISQLQEIVAELKKVQNGTTVYPEAQYLLRSAQNKLKQLQP